MSGKRRVTMHSKAANAVIPTKPIIRPTTPIQHCSPYATKPCPTPPPTVYENLCLCMVVSNSYNITESNNRRKWY